MDGPGDLRLYMDGGQIQDSAADFAVQSQDLLPLNQIFMP